MKMTKLLHQFTVTIACLALLCFPVFAAVFGTSDSTITSIDGHDRAGTTANRPANMSVGMFYFNTTTGRLEVANGTSLNNVTDVRDATGVGTAGFANGLVAGAGSTGTTTTAGGAGGAFTAAAGAGGAKTGTGAAAGGAGGAFTASAGAGGASTGGTGGVGGAGGVTAGTGGASATGAGGAGGTITVTSGNGGAATGGSGNGGAAGAVNIVLGTGGTSAGGTAGANGALQINGTAGVDSETFVYPALVDDQIFFIAGRNFRVTAITVRPLVAGTDASAVTAVIKKAASGTVITSGTALHTGTIDLKGTINTNQALTLSSTSSDLDIAAGTAIVIDVTGVTTAARGVVTVTLSPQ